MGDMNHMEQIQYVTDTASMITKFQSKFVKLASQLKQIVSEEQLFDGKMTFKNSI